MVWKMVYYVLFVFLLLIIIFVVLVRYELNWDFFDFCFLFVWYDVVKIGIFIYWGVFFVLLVELEWFWWDWEGVKIKIVVDFMKVNYFLDFIYVDFVKNFKVEFFNVFEWVDIF